jgi:putative N-acetyltransferase (TIGR04045 family)
VGDVSLIEVLCPDPRTATTPVVQRSDDPATLAAYHRLRQAAFVREQTMFATSDRDGWDDHPSTIVLVAREPDGTVVGGVRLTPGHPDVDPTLGWWRGSRLVVADGHRGAGQIGAALVRAACAQAEALGALRFDATVQADRLGFFRRLGWEHRGPTSLHGRPHEELRWPIGRIAALVAATKAPLAALVGDLQPGGPGWVGDDAAPVPGSDLVAACDAISPAMVERDPWWAGWCSVLVNVNDVAAKGATPVGLLDAVGATTASLAQRVIDGLADAARAWDVPVLGGHTTLGVPASLAVTMLGRTEAPVPAAGGRAGDDVVLVADLAGGWRPGRTGTQWDSTTARPSAVLREQARLVGRWRPDAAKDVSMAGLAGTLGMLAEASGCGAELDVAAVPRPDRAATAADWLTCFPGFAMVAAQRPGRALPATTSTTAARCGRLVAGAGVRVVWPDGERTEVVPGPVTGLGPA